MTTAAEVLSALYAADDQRDRTQQTTIGLSELGGCARRAYHRLNGDKACNQDQERLPAIMGTAIHAAIADATTARNPFLASEIEVAIGGVTGHVDSYDDGVVTDYKTTTMRSLSWMREHGVSRQQRWQIHCYAAALVERGTPVHTVRLIFIPRDGKSRDVWVHEEPYDPTVAGDALAWLADRRAEVEAREPPEPGEAATYCRDHCPFYGALCPGRPAAAKDAGDVVDMDLDIAAAAYDDARARKAQAELDMEAAREQLLGKSGATDSYRVSWSTRPDTQVPDLDEIRLQYGLRGEHVPTKLRRGSDTISVKAV